MKMMSAYGVLEIFWHYHSYEQRFQNDDLLEIESERKNPSVHEVLSLSKRKFLLAGFVLSYYHHLIF
jgi:hypothetical protein